MRSIIGYLFKGIFVLLPLFLIFSVLSVVFSPFFGENIDFLHSLLMIFGVVVFLILLGYGISKGVGFYFKRKKNKLFSSFPMFVYVIKFFEKLFLIVNFSNQIFERPVLIQREQGKEYKFGFVTQSDLEEFGMRGFSSVYLPDPFSFFGEMVVVKHNDIYPIKKDSNKVSTFVLSGGLIKDIEN
ncbi:DUF502 domain-containing protein [Candidatus Absconditicoccus praedator]|uniref:DUF502 domain-containing protein n=1 Tax=Candidatus Absconditicoccus praedator TaxID=2735562 RepID=UPI001E3DCCBD|nr:DUF502 domain-containing protein [Candidatus Absconditicoccus praedator]UFX83174.1 DUF502 domain-containing protein [Candidatus Absconditicoccus praedator]